MEDGLDPELFRSFARETIDRIRGPFLAQHPPREVISLLQRAFRHALVRGPGEIGVAVEETRGRGARLVTHMADQPFIVDTLRLFLRTRDADYWSGFNVIFRAERDAGGRLVAVGGEGAEMESLALLEAGRGSILDDVERSRSELEHALRLAQATVRDFNAMTRALDRMIERCEVRAERLPDQADAYRETAAFLKWMLRENFVFMGLESSAGALGVQTIDGPFKGRRDGAWPEPHEPGTVKVRKSHVESPIHRAGRIDEVLVTVGDAGMPEEELYLCGMFTYRAVTQPSRHVPILRHVLKAELAEQGAKPGSFRYKGVANVFDSLPTEFLFTTPRAAITRMVDLVLDSEQQQEVGVTVVPKDDGSAFCLVSMPKAQYSDELRRDLQDVVVQGLRATYSDHGLFFGRYDTVLLHYYLTGIDVSDGSAIQELAERIRQLATPWVSRVWRAAARELGEDRADFLIDTYGRAFPDDWMRRADAERAVRDILHLDRLPPHGTLADVFEEDGQMVLRIYQAHEVYLTDLLPVVDNFGLTVISSSATQVASRGGRLSFDSFVLSTDEVQRARLERHGHLLVEALPAVYEGRVDNDEINELVLKSGLTWRAVDVLRGYLHYLRQLNIHVTIPRARAIMLQHPVTCSKLYELFEAKFAPGVSGREARVEACREEVEDLLRQLRTHDEDVVLGGIHNLIEATLRTNAFRDDRVSHYTSFKFECARVRDMKGSRPLFEIYVHAREVEGVHLRFGRVARGGLRWSDRIDFRAEVLGLVTTQQVKNVVIVPEGSKGGFYLHEPEPDPQARRAQADRLYKTFIRGLLDLTDNVVDGKVVPPPDVVRWDADDPYLVVAADKGTAHLSDTANAISEAYGFWLGDAFASGGSNGYDHKKVGITARGAWVLVRRHFAELGKDPYAEPFTVVGVGDLGGDVFGNGLIESRQARLLAAFNHLHIFLDPDPDPARSWEERKRLFDLGGREGGWDRYDRTLLSEGGGVYERSARSIELSPQARAMLGIDAPQAGPEEVIRAILRMDVDLLWQGGIGTYVKASHETHDHADDRSNDRARVDASELRTKVIGEGANLSLTQAARIEAALRGVALNTDFIDNSGGVDMSDHEVNLKILLNGPLSRGELTTDARNALLHALTEEVAGLVLANNDAQGRQISRDVIRSRQDVFPFARAIAFVERYFGVPRRTLSLPSEAVLEERAQAGLGLTRPELATLSSHVKRWVFSQLIADPRARELTSYEELLFGYFPKAIQERFPTDIREHQLATEIAMTVATTMVVCDAGASFVPMAVESTGRSVLEVFDAYLRAQRLARAYEVRKVLEELRTSVSLQDLYRSWVEVDAGCREVTSFWLSSSQRTPTDAELAEMSEAVDAIFHLQAEEVARDQAQTIARMREADIPEEVATRVVKAQYLNIALMVWWHARKLGLSLADTVVRQLAVGRATRLQEIIDRLGSSGATGHWAPIAGHIMQTRYANLLREVVLKVGGVNGTDRVDALEQRLLSGPLRGLREQVDAVLPRDQPHQLAALVVLEERLSAAIARLGA